MIMRIVHYYAKEDADVMVKLNETGHISKHRMVSGVQEVNVIRCLEKPSLYALVQTFTTKNELIKYKESEMYKQQKAESHFYVDWSKPVTEATYEILAI